MMTQICFATFASVLMGALPSTLGQQKVCAMLIDWIKAEDSNGEYVHVDPKLATNLMKQNIDVPGSIVDAITKTDRSEDAEDAFLEISDQVMDDFDSDLVAQLVHVLENDPQVSEATCKQLKSHFHDYGLAAFLARVFLYACKRPNKKRKDQVVDADGWFINVSQNLCPLCAKNPLMESDGGLPTALYDVFDIPQQPGSKKTYRVLVCLTCARSKKLATVDLLSEPEGWEPLRAAYRSYETVQELNEIFANGTAPNDLGHVVQALVDAPDPHNPDGVSPDKFEATAVIKKIRPEYMPLRLMTKALAEAYYYQVESLFTAIDDGDDRAYRRIRTKVRGIYEDAAAVTDDQPKIFDDFVDWLAKQADVPNSSQGALVVAAFFVQNCQVFDEVSK
ncbi:ABC-three component system protein [Dermabacteraceae bacterium P13138]